MTDQAKPASRPWRRFLRFSVRGMIVLVLVVGGWLGWIVRSARIQREAVQAIKSAGGHVLYDWQCRKDRPRTGNKPPAPNWFVKLAGVDCFCNVTFVQQFESPSLPMVLVHIGRLKRLEMLFVYGPELTDNGLVHLEHLTDLKVLVLRSPNVTDAGLPHLRGLAKLAHLDLSDTKLTDVGLAHLNGLTDLRSVRVRNNGVTHRGFEELRWMIPGLELGLD